jgi:ABC-type lipoprotein release transport system permease subunit
MFYTLKLAFKNIFSRKSSFVIIAFITFAITMLIVINSVFDGTDNGIRTVFMDSFTGDLVIREKTKDNVSLFGNVSLVDESIYPIDELSFYEDIEKYLNEQSEVKSFIPQVSTFSLLEVENKKFKSAIFGINVEEYFNIMPSLQLIEGSINDNDEKCILVSETWVQNFKKQ